MPHNVNGDRPPSPLVKQLKQKFDRMTANDNHKIHLQSQTGLSKVHRVGNDERDGAYPLMPVCCSSPYLTLFHPQKNYLIISKRLFFSILKG
jgi:hypothetical protein